MLPLLWVFTDHYRMRVTHSFILLALLKEGKRKRDTRPVQGQRQDLSLIPPGLISRNKIGAAPATFPVTGLWFIKEGPGVGCFLK